MHTRPFQARSAFSPNKSTYGFPIQLQRPPAKHQSTGSRRQPRLACFYGKQWARGETRKHCFPEQSRIAAELGFPRSVSLSRMQLPETSFVPFLRCALGGSLPSWRKSGGGACAHKAFSGPISLLPEVENVWSWFPAPATTSKAPVHREQEAALPLIVPMGSNGLG